MTDTTRPHTPTPAVHGRPRRKHHWWRWIVGSIVVIVLVVVVAGAFAKPAAASSPLTLPAAAATAPVGPLDGGWTVVAGSAAGFRVQETFLGFTDDSVGRTSAVTGTMVVSGDQITAATFPIDLTAMQVGGKPAPQFETSLDTPADPTATATLTQPVLMGPGFITGSTVTSTATGLLTMHGVAHPVRVTISSRRDGTALQIAGSIPIAFGDWGITGPAGYGVLGSLADHGTAEFLLVLHRP